MSWILNFLISKRVVMMLALKFLRCIAQLPALVRALGLMIMLVSDDDDEGADHRPGHLMVAGVTMGNEFK